VDPRMEQVLLGNKNKKTTQIYTHVNSTEIAKIRSPLATILSQKKEGHL
jgi:site-specific recombinase XerD